MVKTTWIMPLLSMLSHAFAERYIIHGVQQHSGSTMSFSTRMVVHGYLIIEVNGELPSRNFLRELSTCEPLHVSGHRCPQGKNS